MASNHQTTAPNKLLHHAIQWLAS